METGRPQPPSQPRQAQRTGPYRCPDCNFAADRPSALEVNTFFFRFHFSPFLLNVSWCRYTEEGMIMIPVCSSDPVYNNFFLFLISIPMSSLLEEVQNYFKLQSTRQTFALESLRRIRALDGLGRTTTECWLSRYGKTSSLKVDNEFIFIFICY